MDWLWALYGDLLGWTSLSPRRGCLLMIVLVPLLILDYWLWTINFPVWIMVIGTATIVVLIVWPASVND